MDVDVIERGREGERGRERVCVGGWVGGGWIVAGGISVGWVWLGWVCYVCIYICIYLSFAFWSVLLPSTYIRTYVR